MGVRSIINGLLKGALVILAAAITNVRRLKSGDTDFFRKFRTEIVALAA
jgi:hypothetical protein